MTKRPYDSKLRAEILDLIDGGEAFRERQAEIARQHEATNRKMDAIILSNDPLPPDAAA